MHSARTLAIAATAAMLLGGGASRALAQEAAAPAPAPRVIKPAPPATPPIPAPPATDAPDAAPVQAPRPNPAPRLETHVEPLPPAPLVEPVVQEQPTTHRQRKGILVAGVATFATSYGIAALAALGTLASMAADPCDYCAKQAGFLVVPVAGPLLAERNLPAYARPSSAWPYAVWSLVEAAGATMAVVGLVGRDVPVERATRPSTKVSLVPALTRQLSTLSLHVTW